MFQKILILISLSVTAFSVMLNIGAIPVLIPKVAVSFSISNYAAARIIPAYMISYGISSLFYSYVTKRIGKKNVIIITLSFFILFSIVCGITKSMNTFIIFRSLTGVASAAIMPISLACIGDMFTTGNRGKAVGFFLSSVSFSSVLGVFLSGIVQWRWMFFLPAIVSIVALVCIIIFLHEMGSSPVEIRTSYFQILFSREGIRIYGYTFLTGLFVMSIYSWLGVFLYQEIGMTKFEIANLFTLTGISSIFGGILGGIISDRFGRAKSIAGGLLIVSIAIYGFTFGNSFVLFMIIAVVFGLGRAMSHSALVTMITEIPSKPLEKATVLNSFIRFISGGIGTLATEAFLALGDFRTVFTVYASMCVLLSFLTSTFLKRNN